MSSIADRRKDYKKGVDAQDARRRREETAISLRKNKREEGLSKRRNLNVTSPVRSGADTAADSSSGTTGTAKQQVYTTDDIPMLLQGLHSPDKSDVVKTCRGFRKLLSAEDNPPVDEVIASGAVPLLVGCLSHHDVPELQFEAAWALTNIASTDKTAVIVEAGAIPHLVALLRSENADLREQCAWCLGNVSGDSPELRDVCLEIPTALEGLLLNISQPANRALLRNCVWALSNFCRGKPQPDLAKVGAAIPTLVNLLGSDDEEVQTDAGWALSYLSDGGSNAVNACIVAGAAARLVAMLNAANPSVVTPALRTLGNFVTGDDQQTQAALEAGSLPILARLLSHPKKSVRKETCWMLSNIAAGTHAQIGAVCSTPGILPGVLSALESGEWDVKREAAWVVSNIATGGAASHIQLLVEQGAIRPMCDLLSKADAKIIVVTLEALEAILSKDDAESSYAVLVDEADGLDAIEQLQLHENEDIYVKANSIISNYFADGDDDDDLEELQPKDTEGGFQFGMQSNGVSSGQQMFDFGIAG